MTPEERSARAKKASLAAAKKRTAQRLRSGAEFQIRVGVYPHFRPMEPTGAVARTFEHACDAASASFPGEGGVKETTD